MLLPVEKAAPVLAFRAIPTTLLALITYLCVYVALLVTDALPNVPQDQGGLDIQQAYEDLRQACFHSGSSSSFLCTGKT